MKNILMAFIAVALVACGQNESAKSTEPQYSATTPVANKEYVFAIHPLNNPVRLNEIFGPIIDYLNRNIPDAKFRLEASRNYEEFEKKLYSRQPDFAVPNPLQTLNSLSHGYHVIAKFGNDEKFTGLILVRRDSNIKKVTDLKGKKVSYPAKSALAAAMMPQYYLQTHGLDINHDIENLYVGSQESSIMNVYLGMTAAAGSWPLSWEAFQNKHPDKARELEAKWETPSLIHAGIVARDDVPEKLAKQVAQLLDKLHTTEEGKAMLARIPLSRFELAEDKRYDVVKDFINKFGQTVYPMDELLK